MHVEQKSLEQKNHDLAAKYREKAKTQTQMERLYKSLKHQQLAAGMELAADHDAEDALHAVVGGHFGNINYRQHTHSRAGSNTSGARDAHRNDVDVWNNQIQGSRAGLQSARQYR